jgi:hypothetical protein
MIRLLFVILFFQVLPARSQEISHEEVQKMYFDGWTGKCGAEELAKILENRQLDSDPVLMAYKGAAITTTANCKMMPFSKLSVFNEGKKWIELAVKMDSGNVEVRFLRYTVQSNIPGFLNYDNTESDKKFLLENLPLQNGNQSDTYLQEQIVWFLLKSEELTDQEKEQIKSYLNGRI